MNLYGKRCRVEGLRFHAPPSDVKVFDAETGELKRTEPATYKVIAEHRYAQRGGKRK